MTKNTQLDEFRQRMADAASLSQDDPRRIAMVRQVVDAGPWAEAEWLDSLPEKVGPPRGIALKKMTA